MTVCDASCPAPVKSKANVTHNNADLRLPAWAITDTGQPKLIPAAIAVLKQTLKRDCEGSCVSRGSGTTPGNAG